MTKEDTIPDTALEIEAGSALEDRTNWQATIENTQGVLATEQPALRTEHDLGLEL